MKKGSNLVLRIMLLCYKSLKVPSDIEDSLVLALKCIDMSADVFEEHAIPMTKKERANMRGRRGNLNNEIGSFYQNRLRELLRKAADEEDEGEGR